MRSDLSAQEIKPLISGRLPGSTVFTLGFEKIHGLNKGTLVKFGFSKVRESF